VPKQHFLPRFSQVAFMVQMSHLSLEEEIAKLKGGALTPEDKKELEERAQYAKKWLEEYAPEKFVFKLQDTLPEGAKTLTDIQKQALKELKDALDKASGMPDGETIHHALHDMKEKIKIAPADLFSAVYLAFLGKAYGPKAGWFLSVLDKDFVVKRLQEASR
jgi:lysyl-tRNA synthetase class 1